MSSYSGQKNIQSIRTFSEDAAKAKALDDSFLRTAAAQPPLILKDTEHKEPASVPKAPPAPATFVKSENKFLQKKELPKVGHKARLFVPKTHVDLSDEVASVSQPTKNSILSDSDDVFHTSTRAGNIIRDTKRKRFRLFPAMLEAATSWFKAKKEAYIAFRHPNHTVTKAETRRKILQASVRENTQAPKEDFKDVVTRMKTVERTPVASTLRFKEKSAVEAPSWTHVTEERGSLEKSEPLVEEAAEIKKEEPAPEALPVIEEPASAAPIAVETTAGYEAPEEQASLVQEEPERVRQGIAEPVHVELAHVQQTPSTTQAYAETPYQGEQKLPIIYFVAVILAASLLGIGISYYFFVVRNAPVQQIVVEYKVPQLLFTSDQVPFRFGEDRRQSLQVIKDFVDRSQTVSQLYPTVIEEGIEKPAPTQTIISELQFQAPGSFTRTISEITFGGTPQRQPFIILKVTSFDTAFAGILEWEKTMSADLTPLFGEVVINSFDPSARTDTQVREAFFKDVIASNKNARLLLDEEGEDRIVYTFTNQNTILITTNREALDELLPLIR